MRTLCLVIFLLASAVAFGQYCDCYSYIYADAGTGDLEADAYSDFPDCFDSCYVYVDLQVSDNSGQLYEQGQDAYDFGQVELTYFDHVTLNNGYEEDSSHEVDGYDSEYDYVSEPYNNSEVVNIPGFPSIWWNYVDVTYPYNAYVDFTVSPPVLDSVTFTIGGQTTLAGAGQSDYQMYFQEGQLPYGTSAITFTGWLYGYATSATVGYANRVHGSTQGIPQSQFATCAGENLGILTQAFFLKTFETWDVFSYTLPTNGPLVLALSGEANASTDAATECGFEFVAAAATNTVTDPTGYYWSADMTPPSGPTLPPQGPYYQSRDNSWFEWLHHGGNGNICMQFIPGADVGLAAWVAFPCSNVTMP